MRDRLSSKLIYPRESQIYEQFTFLKNKSICHNLKLILNKNPQIYFNSTKFTIINFYCTLERALGKSVLQAE